MCLSFTQNLSKQEIDEMAAAFAAPIMYPVRQPTSENMSSIWIDATFLVTRHHEARDRFTYEAILAADGVGIDFSHMNWTIQESDVDVIIGLSKFVRDLPDQLVSAHFMNLDRTKENIRSYILDQLLERLYEIEYNNRIRQDFVIEQNLRATPTSYSVTRGVRLPNNIPHHKSGLSSHQPAPLTLAQTITAIGDDLRYLKMCLEDLRKEDFINRTRLMINSSDWIRLYSSVYLDVIYPTFINNKKLMSDALWDARYVTAHSSLEHLSCHQLIDQFERLMVCATASYNENFAAVVAVAPQN